MKRPHLLLCLCSLLVAASGHAVTAAPEAPVAAPAAASPAPTSAAVREATALAQGGKVQEAVARLERERAQLEPRGLSLLGALYLQVGKAPDALAVLRPLADRDDAEAAVLYNAGRAAVQSGELDAGRIYLARSVDKFPASPAARDLGLLLAREGRVVEAYSLLRPWTLSNADDGDARLVAATLAITLERPEEAQQLLYGLVESPAVRLLEARVRVLVGDGPKALELLQPVLAQHPPAMDLEVRRVAAEAYLLAGQPAKAVEQLRGKAGNVPALVLILGRAERQAGDATAALATLGPLASRLPDDPRALGDPRPAAGIAREYGELLLNARRAGDAVPYLQKATKLQPQSEEAWSSLARALDASGRTQDAAQARAQAQGLATARQAAAATPRAPAPAAPGGATPADGGGAPAMPAYAATALSLAQQGKTQQALDVLQQRLAAVPDDELAHTLEVRMLLAQQQYVPARKAVDAALARAPQNPNFIYLRGAVEMAMHDLDAAERDLRQTLALDPKHLAAMSDLAVLLMTVGKNDEARGLLEQVLRLNPQDRNAAANLEQLRKGAG